MKKHSKILALALILSLVFALASCAFFVKEEAEPGETEKLWESAIYKEDTTIGEGEKNVTLIVTALEKSVTLTLKTNADNLGDAIVELGVASGDESAYGLYVKSVNGMRADYDLDKAYWSLKQDGTALPYGVSDAVIEGNEVYELAYEK